MLPACSNHCFCQSPCLRTLAIPSGTPLSALSGQSPDATSCSVATEAVGTWDEHAAQLSAASLKLLGPSSGHLEELKTVPWTCRRHLRRPPWKGTFASQFKNQPTVPRPLKRKGFAKSSAAGFESGSSTRQGFADLKNSALLRAKLGLRAIAGQGAATSPGRSPGPALSCSAACPGAAARKADSSNAAIYRRFSPSASALPSAGWSSKYLQHSRQMLAAASND